MSNEVTESMIIGGNEAAALRLMREHNSRARQNRITEASAAAGSLVARPAEDLNGAAMDPRVGEELAEGLVPPRHFTVDI